MKIKDSEIMTLPEIARQLNNAKQKIILIYAFNSTGKTRLSTAYKDITKELNEDRHAGVYYNAFSEDLFVWNNDIENDEQDIALTLKPSSLNQFHSLLTEEAVSEKLEPYNPKYTFRFEFHSDAAKGIESIRFFAKETSDPGNEVLLADEDGNLIVSEDDDYFIDVSENEQIKISRGEERIFVWCFFLALFEVEGWADEQSAHFFIDDPVSSLDDHNIFITATTLFDLIQNYYEKRKIIITTHHLGIASILSDWLSKGDKADKFKDKYTQFLLNRDDDGFSLSNPKKSILLYHLLLLQELDAADSNDELYNYHFVLLRQVLENIASFLGVGQVGYVLKQIGIEDDNKVATIVNSLSHKKYYYFSPTSMVPDNKKMFKEILDGLKDKYQFRLHA